MPPGGFNAAGIRLVGQALPCFGDTAVIGDGDLLDFLGHRLNTSSHVAPEVSREAADRIARMLWQLADERNHPEDDGD